MELSPPEPGSGHVTRVGALGVFGFLAVVVVLSGCARFETSHDTTGTRVGPARVMPSRGGPARRITRSRL